MASNSVLNAVQHYQRSIEKSAGDVKRLLYCVDKLYKMPITVEHLHQTGVGRTVNALRKYSGELGVAAEAVVNKWKELVATESDMRADNQSSDNEHDIGDEKEDDDDSDKEHRYNENNNHITNDQYSKPQDDNKLVEKSNSSKHHSQKEISSSKSSSSNKSHDRHKSEHRDKSKEHHSKRDKHHKEEEHEHKEKLKSHKEKSDKSSNSTERKEKDESAKQKRSKDSSNKTNSELSQKKREHSSSRHNEKHHSSSSKHKHHGKEQDRKEKSRTKSEHKSHSHSSSKTQSLTNTEACEPSTSTAAQTATTPSERKRLHEDAIANDKGNSPKKHKSDSKQKSKQTKQINTINGEEDGDDGIDSSMGANFADVLGMLNMPQKKAKKSLGTIKQHTSPISTKTKTTFENDSNKTSSSSKINGVRSFEQPSTSSALSSLRNLEKKPDLLASNAKLAPLDPSIALELPIISNNYKPLPLNPTVMDCIFHSSTSSSSRAPPRMLSDAEALSHSISSKTMRTKVYSGVKTGQLLQVPSLFDLCIRILQKNIDALEYTGGVPFDVLRPVLERATPQQLFTFEEYNPYLMEDSDILWQQHVQRNYRGHKREEMETWREMFMRCQEDQERRLNRLAENIKQSQKAIAMPVRKTQLAFVDSLVKPPRNVMRKQEQYGTKSKLVATPAARVAALSNVTPNAGKQGDTRLRVAATISHDPAQVSNAASRPKKAPLMAKTLQFMRGRYKR